MKGLTDYINEAAMKLTYNLSSDIYNMLSDLAFEYDKKRKKFDEDEVRAALDNFVDKFFVEPDDEDNDD